MDGHAEMTERQTMVGIISAVALLLTGCGQDNPVEPRADAQALVGHADEPEHHPDPPPATPQRLTVAPRRDRAANHGNPLPSILVS